MKNKSLNYLNFVFLTYLKKLKLKKADSTTKNFVQNLNFSNKFLIFMISYLNKLKISLPNISSIKPNNITVPID
jgi:hypothetical protein